MSDQDVIHRFIFDNTDIRGEILSLHKTKLESGENQSTPKALLPVFGDFLSGACLLSEVLKFEGILSLQASGDGPVSMIMAEANNQGHVRGIIKLSEEDAHKALDEDFFSKATLPELLGKTSLIITIDPDKGQRYQGIVPIEEPSLAKCLEHYFYQSEQLPTQVHLFSNEEHCGGLFLQCLPAQLVTDNDEREKHWDTARALASTCTEEELFTLSHQELLLRLFHDMQCRLFEPKALSFKCSCSEARCLNALKALGQQEVYKLLAEHDLIQMDCQFCATPYAFGKENVDALFNGDTDESVLH
ncbi:MAG: Hsp33 family molecular chaperone HslO [Alteromonadaceae bacterium]|nr:MAG: Hsp33 family molecular chaperone HslO [Alteromonadaceae bacterium]